MFFPPLTQLLVHTSGWPLWPQLDGAVIFGPINVPFPPGYSPVVLAQLPSPFGPPDTAMLLFSFPWFLWRTPPPPPPPPPHPSPRAVKDIQRSLFLFSRWNRWPQPPLRDLLPLSPIDKAPFYLPNFCHTPGFAAALSFLCHALPFLLTFFVHGLFTEIYCAFGSSFLRLLAFLAPC